MIKLLRTVFLILMITSGDQAAIIGINLHWTREQRYWILFNRVFAVADNMYVTSSFRDQDVVLIQILSGMRPCFSYGDSELHSNIQTNGVHTEVSSDLAVCSSVLPWQLVLTPNRYSAASCKNSVLDHCEQLLISRQAS